MGRLDKFTVGKNAIASIWKIVQEQLGTGNILTNLCHEALFATSGFSQGFGASSETAFHHAYPGGLANHTYEVVRFALHIAKLFPETNIPVLLTAAVWHDFAKVYEYDEEGKKLPYRSLIRHVSGSYASFMKAAARTSLPFSLQDAVGHCILAHHGRREWGSLEPQTLEALILHQADMLSAF